VAVRKIFRPDEQFLAGPNSRGNELSFLLKVGYQFFRAFRKLHFVGPCVTVFGSARFDEDNKYYKQARTLGQTLSKMGFAVMTGGGPGIMEAANRGAYEAKGQSIGCTIKLPKEQTSNPYMTKVVDFDFFFVRKAILTKYSYAFVVMPGGFGTLDELFETLTLIQTKTLHNFPVVIMGKEYYQDLYEMVERMIQEETISPNDKDLILITDDLNQACHHIATYITKNYKISYKPKWILGEG
jgi:uncharacterized protein (TIGR00730 family)